MKEKIINLKNIIVNFCKGNKRNVLIALAVILVLVIVLIIGTGKPKYGNTYGNLRNKGIVAEKGNQIYYIAFDEGNADGVYKIKKNGKGKEKVSSEYGYYLNISGSYMYYISLEKEQLIKAKLNGSKSEVIAENVGSAPITVVDNWIYYFEGTNLFKIKTNGKKRTQLSNKAIENYQIVGNKIYYSYENDGKQVIAKMDLNGKNVVKIDEEAGKEFFVKGNKIYYINENYDMENYEYKYELCKVKTNGKNKEKICDIEGSVDTYTVNFTENAIYYAKAAKNDKMAIYSIKLNGKDETKIKIGRAHV